MRPKSWLFLFVTLLAAATGIVAALNLWVVDFYGLGRDDRGRSLPTLGDHRVAKYLLASRYVPANFDGLLLGPSITANWRSSLITGFRIYNASLNGANIIEEKAVADQALRSGKMRAVVLLIHPSLTLSHDFKTAELTPRLWYSALGSETLFDAYKDEYYRLSHPQQLITDGWGTEYYGDEPHPLNAINIELLKPGVEFTKDELALKTYRELLHTLQTEHIRTLLVVPPIAEELLQRKPEQFARYTRTIVSGSPTDFQLLDFTTPEYASFRRDGANFTDGVHMTRKGADRATAIVSRSLNSLSTKIPPAPAPLTQQSAGPGSTPRQSAAPRKQQRPWVH